MRTLPQLLWSDLQANADGAGAAQPSCVPALGLPYRVAAFLLAEALRRYVSGSQSEPAEPQVWSIQESHWSAVRDGRTSQFHVQPRTILGQTSLTLAPAANSLLELRAFSESTMPAHAAYSIPDCVSSPLPNDFAVVWGHALSFFTAIEGAEGILDQLWTSAPRAVPFEEQWSIRSRLPIPPAIWRWLEEMALVARTGHDGQSWREQTAQVLELVEQEFADQPLILPDEFLAERCDVFLGDSNSPEFPCAIERRGMSPRQADPAIALMESTLCDNVTVRIAQLTTQPLQFWSGFPDRFPHLERAQTQRIFRQVTQAFQSQGDGPSWSMAVFPEVCLPPEGRSRFEALVSESHRGGVIGCLWREVESAVASIASTPASTRYFVNEALLAVPLPTEDRSRPVVRSFLVRKPLPAHPEIALARCLSQRAGRDNAWQMLPGRRVFRFVHPSWGDFTVAICSDLLDPAPWLSMRGHLLHVFMCSYNKDVSLFDSLTWVRAYENFANLVATNCGAHGGSFAWSPKSGESKEVARIRGSNLFVLADVMLPVQSLFNWQRSGTEAVIAAEVAAWNGNGHGSRNEFKAPPPSFVPRQS